MDITKFSIGTPVIIKTDDDIYDSYISAITLSDENFVYFKSGSIRTTLLDKLKTTSQVIGNKLDVNGGLIKGSLSVAGQIYMQDKEVATKEIVVEVSSTLYRVDLNTIKEDTAFHYCSSCTNIPVQVNGFLFVQKVNDNYVKQEYTTYKNDKYFRSCNNGIWGDWFKVSTNGITESGSNGNGSYIKYDDGTMIAYGVKTIRDVGFTQVGQLYYSAQQTINFPEEFIESPSIKVSCRSSNFAWSANELSTINALTFYIMHTTNVIRNIAVTWQAIGRWKQY